MSTNFNQGWWKSGNDVESLTGLELSHYFILFIKLIFSLIFLLSFKTLTNLLNNIFRKVIVFWNVFGNLAQISKIIESEIEENDFLQVSKFDLFHHQIIIHNLLHHFPKNSFLLPFFRLKIILEFFVSRSEVFFSALKVWFKKDQFRIEKKIKLSIFPSEIKFKWKVFLILGSGTGKD